MKYTKSDEEVFYRVLYDKTELNLDLTNRLLNKVKSDSFLFSLLPGVESLAVCNSIAFRNPHNGSDIDLFFILKSDRFFIYRWIITLIFFVAGQRRSGLKIENRYCLSFFVSNDCMNLEEFLIENDIYFYFWFKELLFLDSNMGMQKNFLQANKWHEGLDSFNRLPCFEKSLLARFVEKFVSFSWFKYIENFTAKYSLARIEKKNTILNNPFGVIAKHGILKFHVKDIRKEIRDSYYFLRSK